MTRVRYCRHCFRVGQKCQCSAIPHQAPGPTAALWMQPTVSYMAMASSTETTASTSAVGITHPSWPHQPPELPPLEAMDTSHPLTSENLLLTAGVGRGGRGQTLLQIPTTPGPCQTRPRMPQPQVPAPGRQEVTQVTPYRQQVYPPRTTAPKPSTTPSATQGQDREGPAREDGGARGRSSSRGSPGGR